MKQRKFDYVGPATGLVEKGWKPQQPSKSVIKNKQIPLDFSCLQNQGKWLPSNLDGTSHRQVGEKDYFLHFECKHGEPVSKRQEILLAALARRGDIVLIVHCKRVYDEALNVIRFTPLAYEILNTGEVMSTNVAQFASRYENWCRQPSKGLEHWQDTKGDYE